VYPESAFIHVGTEQSATKINQLKYKETTGNLMGSAVKKPAEAGLSRFYIKGTLACVQTRKWQSTRKKHHDLF